MGCTSVLDTCANKSWKLSLKVIENRLNQLQRKKIENKLKSNQYLAIECVVARGIPLAMLHFPMLKPLLIIFV